MPRRGDGGGDPDVTQGRLSFRPTARPPGPARGNRAAYRLDTEGGSFALVHPPRGGDGPVRLVVLLHGAGGNPERTRQLLSQYADSHRLLLVVPKSRGRSWDVITGGFGPDVRAIDELLARVSSRYEVDGYSIAGFSDGASYALTLGLTNGDVFDSVVAFSPGFQAARSSHGAPRFFVSHGLSDQVLPIDRCSRRLVPALQRAGYDVTYEEFPGGHEIPLDVRERAVDWIA